jgi:hypothetical protein
MLETEQVVLWYYPQLKLVHHKMLQVPDSASFRELLNKGADVVEHFKVTRWLSDDRANTTLPEADKEWADREWLPRVIRAGFKYWAIVLPTSAIGKLNMRRIATHHAGQGVTSLMTDTFEEAFDWIVKQGSTD